jgi:hypothetical protein
MAGTRKATVNTPDHVFDHVRLIPVINAYELIANRADGPRLGDPAGDAAYREAVVAAGLPAPTAGHPWMVRATDLRAEPDLTTLVLALLADRDADASDGPGLLDRLRDARTCQDALEEVPALPGGYLLEAGHRCVAAPQCCGDLATLPEWRAAASHEGPSPAMVWIGHPWLLVGAEAPDVLVFTGLAGDDPGPYPELARIRRDALARAVTLAVGELAAFAGRLRAVSVGIVGPEHGGDLTDALLGHPEA